MISIKNKRVARDSFYLINSTHQVYGRVEVLPDESVVSHIPAIDHQHLHHFFISFVSFLSQPPSSSLDEVLLGDISGGEVADPIHRHNPNVLDCPEKVLERDEVAPDPRLVRRLDFIVEVVEDDVVDVLVPAKDLSDLPKSALSHLHPDGMVIKGVEEREDLKTSCCIWNLSFDLKAISASATELSPKMSSLCCFVFEASI